MIQVVDRTFDILEMLARADRPLSNTDIAASLGIAVQTTNNLLRTLYNRGYVSQDSSRHYRLGAQCFFLGSFADRWSALRRRLAEPLRELVAESGFTAFAGVIENDRLLSIALLQPGERELLSPPQGWWDELHSTASGRLLLALLPAAERARLFARTARRQVTGKTVVDTAELETLCAGIARAGYAEVRDESRLGVSSLAIPLHDLGGQVIAALAVSGGNRQWDRMPLPAKRRLLEHAAGRLEKG